MNDWKELNDHLEREFTFENFGESMEFVLAVAGLAEEVDHHPDIDIRYDRVKLTLCTHEAGSTVTDKDRDLAEAIDLLFS